MAKRVRKKTKAELASPTFRSRAEQQAAVLIQSYALCDRLPKKRRDFILDIASDQWIARFDAVQDYAALERETKKWDRVRNGFLKEDVANPLELHWFSLNWDAERGAEPLRRIVKHANCDAGTALRLYWINDPYYYQDYRLIRDCPYSAEREMLQILRAIEQRFKRNDYATRRFTFDPKPWIEEKYEGAGAHVMPSVMWEPIRRPKPRGG